MLMMGHSLKMANISSSMVIFEEVVIYRYARVCMSCDWPWILIGLYDFNAWDSIFSMH